MGYITTTFLGKEHSIPEDVLVYIDLLDFAENVKNQLFNAFVQKLKAEIQKGNVGLLGDDDLAPEIEQQVGRFVSKLCDHGIFTRTVSDYLNGNKGYQYYSDVNKAALAKIKSLLMKRLDSLQEGYEDAVQRADSHVTGMGFSIWSGSFVNHAIYAAMEASTINKQEKEATAQYQREITALCSKLESDYNRETSQYINSEYIPNMEAALTVLTYELLDRYVADMIAHQRFDGKTLDYINIGRSNDLLKNLTLSGNKKAILENAFATCPYNIAVYMQAMKYDLLDYDSFQTAQLFKQHHHILSFFRENWGEVLFPTKFEINYHCINVWASLTNQTPVDLLHSLTEPYARGVVKAYSRIADMLADEHLCRKVIEDYGEDRILAGDAICRSKAREYTASIVPVGVWEQLTEKCGHTNLLELIKNRFPSTGEMDSRGELNAHITEQLYIAFESARKTLVDLIEKKKQQAEARAKEEARVREEQKRKRTERNKKIRKAILKIAVISIAVVTVLLIALTIVNKVIIPAVKYNDAVALMKSGDYEEARDIFIALDGYKDSSELQEQCESAILDSEYDAAVQLMQDGKYGEAIAAFEALDGYKDSNALIENCRTEIRESEYVKAKQLMANNEFESAIAIFESLDGYKDCAEQIEVCKIGLLDIAYSKAVQLMEKGEYTAAIEAFEALNGHKDSDLKITECKNAINEGIYNDAITLADRGSYKEAAELLASVGDYKDAVELRKEYALLGCEAGDIIIFGSYEQDNDHNNGTEEIEWIVLERNGNKALVVSKYCIEWLPFHNTFTEVGWKNSSIRSWLNNAFLNEAFTAQEKTSIISTQNINPDFYDDSESERNWLGITTDRIFLLSSSEADKYFTSDSARKAEGTEYACSKGKSASWYWWLRSANNIKYAGFVSEGELGYGEEVDRSMGIRPAMWIEISE